MYEIFVDRTNVNMTKARVPHLHKYPASAIDTIYARPIWKANLQPSCLMERRSRSRVYRVCYLTINNHAVGVAKEEIVTASGDNREIKLHITMLKSGLCEHVVGVCRCDRNGGYDD